MPAAEHNCKMNCSASTSCLKVEEPFFDTGRVRFDFGFGPRFAGATSVAVPAWLLSTAPAWLPPVVFCFGACVDSVKRMGSWKTHPGGFSGIRCPQ